MSTRLSDEEIKNQVVSKLAGKNPSLDETSIRSIVNEEFGELADRPIRDFLGVLTERAVKKRLKDSPEPGASK